MCFCPLGRRIWLSQIDRIKGRPEKIMSIPHWILSLPAEFAISLVAALPVFELRGSIPLGLKLLGLEAWPKVLLLSIFANALPILPLLLFLRWVESRLEKIKGIGKILRWWFARVEKKSKIVETYGFWGLMLFVAIPIPGSGVWSGAVAATLLEFKRPKAFSAIFLGMLIAAGLVTLGSIGIFKFIF